MKYNHLSFILLLLIAACSTPQNVDLIIHNATVYTVDESFSTAEAIAIKDGKIVEVGPEHQILNGYSAVQYEDAKKAFVYPGLIDAHAHLLGYALQLQRVDLVGTKSFDEVVQRVQAQIANADSKWVLGRGWDQNDWSEKVFPNNDTFDILFPNHHIVLKRIDGHAALVSNNVLAMASIDDASSVQGGQIVMDANGPTGVLIDAAVDILDEVIPEPSLKQKAEALLEAQHHCLQLGLTQVVDAGLKIHEIQLIDSLQKKDFLLRVYAMYSASKEVMEHLNTLKIDKPKLTARAVKVYADGALGSRGAYLLDPYEDDPENQGLLITPSDSVKQWAQACYDNDFQLAVHCIGDGANRMVLDAMSEVLREPNDRRWRIEHAQVVHPEDRSKFGAFNIIPSMQPTHATSDMYWANERLGEERTAYAYALRSLKQENGLIPLGTDFPVEEISPMKTFYAAVVRKDAEGHPSEGFYNSEALSREDALRGMTIWAAIANFGDSALGSIVPAKRADLVMLDTDLMKCSEERILEAQVLKTWIDGELVYTKP